jgi:hypothetical protein
VVAGRDDDEQDERRIEERNRTRDAATTEPEDACGDDQRVADVHARHRGVGVVDRADEPVVQVDVRVRDRVGDPDTREARRRGRIGEEADE